MPDQFAYQIAFNEETCDVGKFTADIYAALNLVEHYNWKLKIANVVYTQAVQIAANLADASNPNFVRANINVQDKDRERSQLEHERQVVLNSVDQAIRCLEEQRQTTVDLAARLEGVDDELHQHALLAVVQWDTDIASLKLRRAGVDNTVRTSGLEQSQDQDQSSNGDDVLN